jgi:ribosomal protein L16 Arg81 hydroxylase
MKASRKPRPQGGRLGVGNDGPTSSPTTALRAAVVNVFRDDEFLRRYWQRRAYVSSRLSDRNLLDLDSLFGLVRHHRRDPEKLRLVGPATASARRVPALKGPDDPALRYTLLYTGLQIDHPVVGDVANRLARLLRCPVNTNCYITPRHQTGFAAHYDTHDVVIVQLHGSKRWAVYGPRKRSPLWFNERTPIERHMSRHRLMTLGPGSVLYLPRGVVHRAHALSSTSIHLTFGLHLWTWFDYFELLLQRQLAQSRWREAIPIGVDTPSRAHAEDLVRSLAAAVRSYSAERAVRALMRGAGGRQLCEHESSSS